CQTASELRADLKRLKREMGSDERQPTTAAAIVLIAPASRPTDSSSDAQVAVALLRRHAKRLALIAAVVVVLVAAGVYALWQRRAPATGASPETASLDDFQLVQL